MYKIGVRAYIEIRNRAKEKGIKTQKELESMGIGSTAFYAWKKEGTAPSGYFLRQMALNGYDVIYILTGEKQ